MTKITLIVAFMLSSCRLFASHYASADIRYEYIGAPNTYKVVLTVLKACEPNSIDLSNAETIQYSSTCFLGNFSHTVPASPPDTVSFFCPGNTNSCLLPSSIYPAFIRISYTDTVVLNPCADWTLSWSNSARNAGIVNLLNPAGLSIYIDSKMDNVATLNTNAWMPNPSPFIISTNNLNYIPFHAVDAESDSLDFQFVQPLNTGPFNPCAFNAPNYSLSQPLGPGSYLAYDPVNEVLVAQTPVSGKYAVDIRVDEYRNGVLVGSTMRDMTIVALSGTTLTAPMPTPSTSLHYVTCPGQTHSINLTFEDSTITDYVTLNVVAPFIPGWTFTSTVINGTGTATANISWTTPLTMDPATLPQFYFNIIANDDACPANAHAQYAVVVQTAQCNTDSVWSGDANGDYSVNIYDPLAIAIAYGETGPARAGAPSTAWAAEYCLPWSTSFSNGVDMKHADCDGDGLVDNTDLGAVTTNWGNVHLKGGVKAKVTSDPDLYFDITGISFQPGTTVSVPIKLGTVGNMMNGIYGLATNISVLGMNLTNAPTITYPASWIGNAGNTIRFAHTDPIDNSVVDWAYARNDHQDVSGSGTIAMLTFSIPANATPGTIIDLNFNNTVIIDHNQNIVTAFNEVPASVSLQTVSVGNVPSDISYVAVVPNPSSSQAVLEVMAGRNAKLDLSIIDITGKSVHSQAVQVVKGANTLALPAGTLAPSVYFIRITENGNAVGNLKWLKQ